jgi:hypothetical protein
MASPNPSPHTISWSRRFFRPVEGDFQLISLAAHFTSLLLTPFFDVFELCHAQLKLFFGAAPLVDFCLEMGVCFLNAVSPVLDHLFGESPRDNASSTGPQDEKGVDTGPCVHGAAIAAA